MKKVFSLHFQNFIKISPKIPLQIFAKISSKASIETFEKLLTRNSVTSTFVDDLMKYSPELNSTKILLCEICNYPAVALLFIIMIQGEPEVNFGSLPNDPTPRFKVIFNCFELMSLMSLRSERVIRQRSVKHT